MGGVVDEEEPKILESHYETLAWALGSKEAAKNSIFYSYTRAINGFAAHLEEREAHTLSKHPEVVSVFVNGKNELHTTHSWGFLGLEEGDQTGGIPPHSLWKKGNFGKDVIIANFDSGVWPESASFDDMGFGPVPSPWKGKCQTEEEMKCNRKLIGAQYFFKGFEAQNGPLNRSQKTARDPVGHGSHTLSTAGGNYVKNASVYGFAQGVAKGGAPLARVATYKVCWTDSSGDTACYDADILAAFDAGIHDGVDVISISLGGVPARDQYYNNSIAVGSLHAVQKGVVVVCSAGNSGPDQGSVSNLSPWIITVGASTIDRKFPSVAYLGNNKSYEGQALSPFSLKKNKKYPLVTEINAQPGEGPSESEFCLPGSLDPNKIKGKIVVCYEGSGSGFDKGEEILNKGGVGMIVVNAGYDGNLVNPHLHVLPATQLDSADGTAVLMYMNTTVSPTASIGPGGTMLNVKPAPVMTDFSSQGPNVITPDILKPDITAPGLSILAAWSGEASPDGFISDKRRVAFNIISGTSMSCPHVTGIAALLKAAYPHWSPAAIKSAIMTTASTMDNTKKAIAAGPFQYGAGHINPNGASHPGLLYDLTNEDYATFLCSIKKTSDQIKRIMNMQFSCPSTTPAISNFNYPSITVSELGRTTVIVKRTVTYVSKGPATFEAEVKSPSGVMVTVNPKKIVFSKKGSKMSFTLVFKAMKSFNGQAFGSLAWKNGKRMVTSPIVVCSIGSYCLK